MIFNLLNTKSQKEEDSIQTVINHFECKVGIFFLLLLSLLSLFLSGIVYQDESWAMPRGKSCVSFPLNIFCIMHSNADVHLTWVGGHVYALRNRVTAPGAMFHTSLNHSSNISTMRRKYNNGNSANHQQNFVFSITVSI